MTSPTLDVRLTPDHASRALRHDVLTGLQAERGDLWDSGTVPTGETIQIKASKSVRFKMGKDLKDTLN